MIDVIEHLLNPLQDLKIINQLFFPKDYAKTLIMWEQQFIAKKKSLCSLGFDDNFQRLWQFYLLSCSASFQSEHNTVAQLVITHA